MGREVAPQLQHDNLWSSPLDTWDKHTAKKIYVNKFGLRATANLHIGHHYDGGGAKAEHMQTHSHICLMDILEVDSL